jgi:hypothetical protein
MSALIEKISERYADEISSLPSIGTLVSFLLVATSAYTVEREQLNWLPPVAELFSNKLGGLISADDGGVLLNTSLGALIIAAAATYALKYLYSALLKKAFTLLGNTQVISTFVVAATNAAQAAGLTNEAIGNCTTTFLSDELGTQRKIFQRIHGLAFVVFTVAVLSLLTLTNIRSTLIFVLAVAGLLCLQYVAVKHYLTRLFPALCIVWNLKKQPLKFGQE